MRELMKYASQVAPEREVVLELVRAGHTVQTLAARFGVTEWTVKRWVAAAHRREHLPYWQQGAGAAGKAESLAGQS
jgi:transposase